MMDGVTQNQAEVTEVTDENGVRTGFTSIYIESGRKFTAFIDLEYNVISETVETLYENLSELADMSTEFQANFAKMKVSLGFEDHLDEDFGFVVKSDNDFQVISFENDPSGELLGRINYWSGDDEWTNWQDNKVTNTYFNFNVYDEDWNYIADIGGNTRVVTDPETGLFYTDETNEREYFDVIKPETDTTAWLALGSGIDALFSETEEASSFSDVSKVRVGEETWTHNVTPDWVEHGRDESSTNTEKRYEYFVEKTGGSGDSTWTYDHFIGSMQVRDGFIELRDENWNLISRVVDPDSALDFDEISASVTGFAEAWAEFDEYLPSSLSDTSALSFSENDWGEIMVFDNAGQMALRIGSWQNEDTWENWDGSTTRWVSSDFNANDADWNQLARTSTWSRYRTEEGKAEYLEESGTNKAFRVYEDEVGSVAWGLFEDDYDLPSSAAGLTGAWTWDEVDSISIGTDVWTRYNDDGSVENTNENTRIEYFQKSEDEWGNSYDKQIGIVEYRDGFIEVRDENWNTIARLVDPANADSFNDIAQKVTGFSEAWTKAEEYLSDEWKPEVPTDAASGTLSRDLLSFTIDEWDNIVVFDETGALIGRINNWSGDDEWTNWQDNKVTNSYFNFNFHDEDWNNIAEIGGNTRVVTDPETGLFYTDETNEREYFDVIKPETDTTAWLALGSGIDALFSETEEASSFSDVSKVRVGEETWTHNVTPDWVEHGRDESSTNTEKRYEYFVEKTGGSGDSTWTYDHFIGSMQVRDGFIELRDENWNLISRVVDPDSALDFDEISASVTGFAEAWAEFDEYLPSSLSDTSALSFSENDWGEIMVFDNAGQMALRIGSWQNEDTWENWDGSTTRWVSSDFNANDADWNQLARTSTWSRYRTEEGKAEYLEESGTNKAFRVYEDEVGSVAWGLFEDDYDLPSSAAGLTGAWTWDEVDSISIGTDVWTRYNDDGSVENTNENTRIEYFQKSEDEWGNSYDKQIGIVEYRDGFIEVRDENWNTIARLVDPANADSFNDIAQKVTGFSEAWTKAEEYLSDEWKPEVPTDAASGTLSRDLLSFTIDEWDNIVVFDETGALIGRINNWSGDDEWTNWQDNKVTNSYFNFNFHDEDWNNIAEIGGNTRVVTDPETGLFYTDETNEREYFDVIKPETDTTAWLALGSGIDALFSETEEASSFSDVSKVRVGEETWTHNVTPDWVEHGRDESSTNTEKRYEYFVEKTGGSGDSTWTYDHFIGSMQVRDGFIELRDENWNLISRVVDPDSALDFDEISASVTGFAEAWAEFDEYLPSSLSDTSALSFSENDWGEIMVFDNAGQMALRIGSWQNEDTWENWDGSTTRWVSSDFNANDADWNQLARTSTWSRYRTEEGKAEYLEESGTNKAFRVYEDEVGSVAWGLFEDDYDLPSSAAGLTGAWTWDEVDSISIGTDVWTRYNDDGSVENTNENTRIEYFQKSEDEWGNSYDKQIGIVEYRDGFIEVRDENWNTIARLVDPANADSFNDIAQKVTGFSEAWTKAEEYLSDEWKPEVPTDAASGTLSRDLLSFTIDEWDNIVVFDETGALIGRINNWSGDDEWTNWQDNKVTNSYFNFNFHDEDWNNIAEIGGNTRVVTDPETGLFYTDETNEREYFDVIKPETDTTAWLALGSGIDALFSETEEASSFSDVSKVRVGEETWTHNVTPDWVEHGRDESSTNTEKRYEYFVEKTGGSGDSTWTYDHFIGSMQVRDGFIELRDENWNLISRVVDPDSALDFDEISASVTGFAEAWAEFDEYLPSSLSDTSALSFSENDWGEIMVFDNAGQMALRIGSWQNEDTWENWDGSTTRWVSSDFNANDADWNQLARTSTWSRYRTEEGKAEYLEESGTNKAFRVYEDEVGSVAWGLFEDDYDLPSSAAGLTGAWTWDEVDSISIGTDVWTRYNDDGSVENTNENTRIEYFQKSEDEWGNSYDKQIGIVEYRDGFIEVRDENWNTIARLMDPNSSSITTIADMSDKFESFDQAIDSVTNYLSFDPSDTNVSFVATDNNHYSIFDATGAMIMRLYVNENQREDNANDKLDVDYYYDFKDVDWNSIASTYGYSEYDTSGNTDQLERSDQTVSFQIDKESYSGSWDDLKVTLGPLETQKAVDAGIIWSDITEISVGTTVSKDFDDNGDVTFESTGARYEYHKVDGGGHRERLGIQEVNGPSIVLKDKDWNDVDSAIDSSYVGSAPLWFGPQTSDILNAAADQFYDYFPANLDDVDLEQIDETSGILVDVKTDETVGAVKVEIEDEGDGTAYWHLDVSGPSFEGFGLAGSAKYDTTTGYLSPFDDGEAHIKFVLPEIDVQNLNDDDLAQIKEDYTPQTLPEGFDWDNIAILRLDEWRHKNPGDTDYNVTERARFVEFDENGNENWDSSENVWIFFEDGLEKVALGKHNIIATDLDRDLVAGNQSDPTWLGDNTSAILENWLVGFESEWAPSVSSLLGTTVTSDDISFSQVTSLDGNGDATGLVFVDKTLISSVRFHVDQHGQNEEEVYWHANVEDLSGNRLFDAGGWNPVENGVFKTGAEHGIKYGYETVKSDVTPEEWGSLEEAVKPQGDIQDFNWSDIGLVLQDTWKNDFDNEGEYDVYNNARFVPVDPDGSQNWNNDNLTITFRNGLEYVREGWDGSYLSTDIDRSTDISSLKAPEWLGSATNDVLGNGLSVFNEKVSLLLGLETNQAVSIELKQLSDLDSSGDAFGAAFIDGALVGFIDFYSDEPNDSGEVWWGMRGIDLQGIKGPSIGGMNKTVSGEVSNAGGSVVYWQERYDKEDYTDSEWTGLLNTYKPGYDGSSIDLQNVGRIEVSERHSDRDGTGEYFVFDQVRFIPEKSDGRLDYNSDEQLIIQYKGAMEVVQLGWDNVISEDLRSNVTFGELSSLEVIAPDVAAIVEQTEVYENFLDDYLFASGGVGVIGAFKKDASSGSDIDEQPSFILSQTDWGQDYWRIFDPENSNEIGRLVNRTRNGEEAFQAFIDVTDDPSFAPLIEESVATLEALGVDILPSGNYSIHAIDHHNIDASLEYRGFVSFDSNGNFYSDFGVSDDGTRGYRIAGQEWTETDEPNSATRISEFDAILKAVLDSDGLPLNEPNAKLYLTYVDGIADELEAASEAQDKAVMAFETHLTDTLDELDSQNTEDAVLTVNSSGFVIASDALTLTASFANFTPGSLQEVSQFDNLDPADESTWIIDGGVQDLTWSDASGTRLKLSVTDDGLELFAPTATAVSTIDNTVIRDSGAIQMVRLDGNFSNEIPDLMDFVASLESFDRADSNWWYEWSTNSYNGLEEAADALDNVRELASEDIYDISGISFYEDEAATSKVVGISYDKGVASIDLKEFALELEIPSVDLHSMSSEYLVLENLNFDIFDDPDYEPSGAGSLTLTHNTHGEIINLKVDNLKKLDDSETIGELNLLDNNDGTFSGTDDTNMVTLTVAFPDGEINSMTALDAHFDPESDGFIEQFFSDIA